MYLGPVVAEQQVLDPSPQTTHPMKEKKGEGVTSAAASLQESNPRVYVFGYRCYGKVFCLSFMYLTV